MRAIQHSQTNPNTPPQTSSLLERFHPSRLYHNLSTPRLIEEALKRSEGWLTQDGAFVAHTGVHTGRSAKDKFVVNTDSSNGIWWDSPYQKPLSEQQH